MIRSKVSVRIYASKCHTIHLTLNNLTVAIIVSETKVLVLH